jgi:hypothetical protein
MLTPVVTGKSRWQASPALYPLTYLRGLLLEGERNRQWSIVLTAITLLE